MLSISPRKGAAGAALILSCLAPAAAEAKAPSQAIYNVTFSAQLEERWQSSEDYADDCFLTGQMCTRVVDGQGSTKLQLKSRRPTKVMVMRGSNGRPPVVGVGTGEGVPLTGSVLRTGSLVTDYGGPWQGGNPDRKADDEGCGTKTVKGAVNFTWAGRNQIAPSMIQEFDDGSCPDGPGEAWDWQNDESPAIGQAIAQVAQSKFLGTKQFTISGSKSFQTVNEPFSETGKNGHYRKSASKTAKWQWTATFRMAGSKKKKR